MSGQLFRAVALPSEDPVQYVGVYVLHWGKQSHPTVGFIPVEEETMSARSNGYENMLEHMLEDLQERSVFPRPEEAQLVFYLAMIEKLSAIEGLIEGLWGGIVALEEGLRQEIHESGNQTAKRLSSLTAAIPNAGKGI